MTMNIRKTRYHQTGYSNIAPKTELPSINVQPQTSRINTLAMDKSKRIAGILSKRISTDFSPAKTTENYYRSVRRPIHQKPQLQFPRTAQLEEKDKRKPVFTGESDLYFDVNLEKYREYGFDCILTPMVTVHNKQTLIQEKKDINGTAIQETQLVGYDKYSTDTVKGNINLEKVREAKRILRRRYANRNNLQKIYAAWDEDNKGFVDLQNMYNMSNKLGLNLNVDEARVLLASANRSGTGQLDLDEFLDLIYNKDDALNVDLDKLSEQVDENYLMKIEEIYKGDNNLIKKLEKDAQRTRNNRHWNQVNLVLKNKLGQIVSGMLAADTESLGYLSPEKFKEIIKRLSISENIVSEQDIKGLFEKFKHKDSMTIDYKAFVDSLKNFSFDYESMYNETSNSPLRFKDQDRRGITLPEEKKGDVNILDCRTLPYEQMLNYWGRSRRVSDDIKKYFPSKNDLQDYFSKSLKINKENVDESYVSQKQLQKIVNHIFKNFDHSGLSKEDFEGFLSSCLYNKQGYTNLEQVCKTIYEETEKEYFEKITYKKKGLPPHFAANNRKQEEEEPLKNALRPVEFENQPEQSPQMDKELQDILAKVDNRVFVGTKKQFDIYNTFDTDKDGYVSVQDFSRKLEDLAILNREEISRLFDYVDSEKKGFVTFADFSRKIHTNMAQENEMGEAKILSYVTPKKQHTKDLLLNNDKFKKTIFDITKALSPPKTVEPKTRFGASPVWSNTFQIMQPVGDSSMAISEAQRFDRSHLHRTLFQKEESDKKRMHTEGRLESIRTHRNFMGNTIETNTLRQESKVANSLKKKAIEQILYEKRAKLRNDFVH